MSSAWFCLRSAAPADRCALSSACTEIRRFRLDLDSYRFASTPGCPAHERARQSAGSRAGCCAAERGHDRSRCDERPEPRDRERADTREQSQRAAEDAAGRGAGRGPSGILVPFSCAKSRVLFLSGSSTEMSSSANPSPRRSVTIRPPGPPSWRCRELPSGHRVSFVTAVRYFATSSWFSTLSAPATAPPSRRSSSARRRFSRVRAASRRPSTVMIFTL